VRTGSLSSNTAREFLHKLTTTSTTSTGWRELIIDFMISFLWLKPKIDDEEEAQQQSSQLTEKVACCSPRRMDGRPKHMLLAFLKQMLLLLLRPIVCQFTNAETDL